MNRLKQSLAIAILRLLSATWRIKHEGEPPITPSVVAFWHGFMLPVWKHFTKFKPAALVSQSKDGRLLTELLEKWKYNVVRGSSSKGGREALDSIINLLDTNIVLITPDGPRGPARQFKAGAVVAARKAGVPLYLCSVQISKSIKLNKSWDKFRIPMPFTKIILNLSLPYKPESANTREETEAYINYMENELNNMQNEK
jgi:lysophospholipid acyltransferase (LPLAT)-like uncharacterized protein